MEYLITGGCGFVGSNLIPYLLDRDEDASVINLDINRNSDSEEFMEVDRFGDRYRFLQGDISDLNSYEDYLKVCDIVVNCAVENGWRNFEERMDRFIRTNIEGVRILSDSSARYGTPMIHLSSDEIYGSCPITVPRRDEHSPLDPTNSYSATMAAGDRLVSLSRRYSDTAVVILRPCELIGPNQNSLRFVPKTIKSITDGIPPVLQGRKGERYRDWLHVLDLCSAVEFMVGSIMGEFSKSDVRDAASPDHKGKTLISGTDIATLPKEDSAVSGVRKIPRVLSGVTIYNVTAEIRLHMSEVISRLLDLMDSELPIREEIFRSNNDLGYNPSGRKIHYQGWTARYTDLDEILRSTVSWYKENPRFLKVEGSEHLKP